MPDARFSEDFWTDPKIKALDMDTQRLFIYLFTNPHRNYCGLYYLPKSFIREQTGLSDRAIDRGIDTLQEGLFIEYSEEYQVVFVKNMLKRQAPGYINDKQIKGITNHLNRLHGCYLIKSFLEHYKSLNITVSYTPIYTPMDVQSQSKSQSNKNISPKSTSSTLSKNGSDNGFSKFWEHYPKRVGKKAALTAWQKAKGKPPIDTILSAISQQIASPNWLKDNGQYIPNPATWINQGRWDDDVGVQTSSAYQPQPRRVCPTCGAWEDKCKCKSTKPHDSHHKP